MIADKTFLLKYCIGAIIVHTFSLQYPPQAFVINTIRNVLILNVVFLGCQCYLKGFQNPWNLVSNQALFPLLYVFGISITTPLYNLTFLHRKIPGPISWRASDLPYWKVFKTGSGYLEIEKLHRQYGPVVRIQPNHLGFASLQAVEDICGVKSKATKHEIYTLFHGARVQRGTLSEYPPTIFTALDNKYHATIRKALNPAFSPAALKELEPLIKKRMDEFINSIETISKRNAGTVNMSEWFENLAFSIMGDLAIGTDFGALQVDVEKHPFRQRSPAFYSIIKNLWPLPWLLTIFKFMPVPNSAVELRRRSLESMKGSIDRTIEEEKNGSKKLLLGFLSENTATSGKLSYPELIANSANLLFAGIDTVATALTFTLYHLIANKDKWERLRTEVKKQFSSEDEINYTSVGSLAYLDAVIRESLRIRPSLVAPFPHLTPPEAMLIDGTFVSGNTTVSVSLWTLMHDPQYFSNPNLFIPERWIESEKGNETCNKTAWLPFSYGSRNCLGQPYSALCVE